jgi:hypothetical protein
VSGNDELAWTFASGRNAGKTLSSWTKVRSPGGPHEGWMNFLEGEWTYEYGTLGISGEVKYTMAAKRNAVVAHGREGDDIWVELIGWRDDTNTMVFTGYAAENGNYWHSDCGEVNDDRVTGSTSGILPDGRRFNGTVTVKRVNDDRFEVHLTGMADGEKLADVGEFSRKQQPSR